MLPQWDCHLYLQGRAWHHVVRPSSFEDCDGSLNRPFFEIEPCQVYLPR
jgi:hypothetical protein